MLRFALLLRNVPAVAEVDLNPVRCMLKGCVVLDARVRIEPRRASGRDQNLVIRPVCYGLT